MHVLIILNASLLLMLTAGTGQCVSVLRDTAIIQRRKHVIPVGTIPHIRSIFFKYVSSYGQIIFSEHRVH